jgi:predicted regulator of amino acid metabolism with ACT domain
LADDPDMVRDASLTLIVEGAVGGSVIGELEGLEMVRGITVRK